MGECSAALAGGVDLIAVADAYIATCRRADALAPDGRCKTFDASADGYGRGEGCGLVVLKRLSDALADGDDVLAVIHGSAVNQDGASGGLTVPNGGAQQALIDEALERAGLGAGRASTTSRRTAPARRWAIPIELPRAPGRLRRGPSRAARALVGSVKTNVEPPSEAAAGVAGLIKTVLALHHETILATCSFETPNPQIEWHALTEVTPTTDQAWPARRQPAPGRGQQLRGQRARTRM